MFRYRAMDAISLSAMSGLCILHHVSLFLLSFVLFSTLQINTEDIQTTKGKERMRDYAVNKCWTRLCFLSLKAATFLLQRQLCSLLASCRSDSWGSHLGWFSSRSWRSSQRCWALAGRSAFALRSNSSQKPSQLGQGWVTAPSLTFATLTKR